MRKLVIVGYDPGTTSGIAVIDTKKNILAVESKREFLKKEMIELITDKGKAIIVASDKAPMPKNVEKFSSSLGCKLFRLTESLSNVEKYKLVNPYAEEINNNHERDALASALKAYEAFEKFFKKADRVLSYLGFSEYYDRVVEMLIKGESENITGALNKIILELKEKNDKIAKKKTEIKVGDKDVVKFKKVIKTLENDMKILKKYNDNLKKKIESLEKKLENEKKKRIIKGMEDLNEEIRKVRGLVEKKRNIIREIKEFREMEFNGKIPVIEVRKISGFKLKDLNKDIGLYRRVLLVNSTENITTANDYDILCLVLDGKTPKTVLGKINFPIIELKEVEIKEVNGIKYLDEKPLDKLIKAAKKQGFEEWVKKYKKRKK
jgi:predicted RNase H-like nuclease (RuvC/YqgF family)